MQPVGQAFRRIHEALARWLAPRQEEAARVGGPLFLNAQVIAPAADLEGFDFDYYGGRLHLGAGFLRAWARLRERLGPGRWEEAVRLFLLHEGHHIVQGMGYRNRDMGRAGVALEAIDYDADVASVELCLGWRWHRDPGEVSRRGEMAALADILDNLLCGMRLFDEGLPGQPLLRVKERRLRRYLIWHFQRARARAARPDLPGEHLRLRERVVLELPGLHTEQELHRGQPVSYVDLTRARDPEVMIYARQRLYRCRDSSLCGDLLAALRSGVVERVSRAFHHLFEQHPCLVPGAL